MANGSTDYGFYARLLHDIVLSRPMVGEFLFDIESARKQPEVKPTTAGAHVLVSGCARAGTTLVTNLLHQTGQFSSLTYRDMPFVMAPATWATISMRDSRASAPRGRAHNDGVEISYDSPEAFEEVFWRTFDPAYFKRSELNHHHVNDQIIAAYRQFVTNVIRAKTKSRYLAKNNNAVVRLSSYVEAFPDIRIVIVFRNPMEQVRSLLRQHELFAKMHRNDAFSLRYMRYLGHFEFGQAHKPFVFERAVSAHSSPEHADYWLDRWVDIYRHVLKEAASIPPGNLLFVNYDRLVRNPAENWHQVLDSLGLGNDSGLRNFSSIIRQQTPTPMPPAENDREHEAIGLYETLTARSVGHI